MTLGEFLDKFRDLAPGTKWFLDDGRLRSADGYCPICFLAKCLGVAPRDPFIYGGHDLKLAFWAYDTGLGLPTPATALIATAADLSDPLTDGFKEIRGRLLQAAGLEVSQ